jgi:membrane fusion protein (multidrug efflux system)
LALTSSKGCAPFSKALIAVAVILLAACNPGPPELPPPQVPVITVAATTVPIYDEWVGQTRGAADIEIRARVTGFIEAIHFAEGSDVNAGDLLYSIDPSELEQNLASARAELARAETLYADAAANLARYRPLAELNAVSARDLDEAVAREGAAKNQVEAARASLRVAEINLGYASVRAPIAGRIGISRVRVGDLVSPLGNSLLNTVSSIDDIRVRFAISEREYLDYSRRYGTDVRGPDDPGAVPLELVLADGTVYPQQGQLVSIDRGIDPATGTLSVEAAFPNPDRLLRPGLFGRVRAMTEERQNAVLVPQRAVTELQGRHQVFVVGADDTVEVRAVEMGPRIGGDWLIEQGVAPGERLALAGVQRLRAGMKVVPVAAESSGAAQPPAAGQTPEAR